MVHTNRSKEKEVDLFMIEKDQIPVCNNIHKIRKEWRKTLKTAYFCDSDNTDSEEEDMDIIELNIDDFL